MDTSEKVPARSDHPLTIDTAVSGTPSPLPSALLSDQRKRSMRGKRVTLPEDVKSLPETGLQSTSSQGSHSYSHPAMHPTSPPGHPPTRKSSFMVDMITLLRRGSAMSTGSLGSEQQRSTATDRSRQQSGASIFELGEIAESTIALSEEEQR